MLNAKEAKKIALEKAGQLERENTERCQKFFDKLVNDTIPRACQQGETSTSCHRDYLSCTHVAKLEEGGYRVTISQGYYDICWS